MPSRNTVREFTAEQYYHIFNRGVENRIIFVDDQDYIVFIGLLKKYLSGQNHNKNNRHKFLPLTGELELLAYCLMPTHFHLLVFQKTEDAIVKLMRRVAIGYVMYFNDRYKRVGGLFQARYKAALIDEEAYLHHISRYIHLNPKEYKQWPYSSLQYYQKRQSAKWLNTQRILDLFNSRREYLDFVADYEANKRELDLLKWQLANGSEL